MVLVFYVPLPVVGDAPDFFGNDWKGVGLFAILFLGVCSGFVEFLVCVRSLGVFPTTFVDWGGQNFFVFFFLGRGILACVSKFWYSDGGYCKRGCLCGPGFLFYGRSVGDLYSFLILFSVV